MSSWYHSCALRLMNVITENMSQCEWRFDKYTCNGRPRSALFYQLVPFTTAPAACHSC